MFKNVRVGRHVIAGAALAVGLPFLGGCSSNGKLLQKDMEIEALHGHVQDLKAQLDQEQARNQDLNRELEGALADYTQRERLLLDQIDSKAVISVPEAALFASGSSRLSGKGMQILDRIAEVVAKYPDREVFIEGHTDNVPIAARYQGKFPSNWELSSARAQATLYYLSAKHKIPGRRLAVVGYGEHRPVAENTSEAGRSQNRRVVIRIGQVLSEGRLAGN